MKTNVVIEMNVQAEAAQRVRALIQSRDKAEAEIADILGRQKQTLGTEQWLAWCEKEFGWKKSAAYHHLNPHQLEADRERHAESRRSGQVRTEKSADPEVEPRPEPAVAPDVSDIETKQTPKETRHSAYVAFALKANAAIDLAKDAETIVTGMFADMRRQVSAGSAYTRQEAIYARRAADAWIDLADDLVPMTKRLHTIANLKAQLIEAARCAKALKLSQAEIKKIEDLERMRSALNELFIFLRQDTP